MIALDIAICVLCLIIGKKIKNRFKEFNLYERQLLDKLFYFHLFATLMYFILLKSSGGDAFLYWEYPKKLSLDVMLELLQQNGRPTEVMFFINYLPSNVFGLSFFTGNIIYSLIGYSAFVYFLALLKKLMPHYQGLKNIKIFGFSIFPLILFFPNLHFWSAGVGKDTLLFFAISIFAYSIVNFKKNIIPLIISFALSIFLRPHIFLFLLVGFGLGVVFSSKIKGYQRLFLTILFGVAFVFIFSKVLEFAKIDELDTESISQFSDDKVKVLAAKGGSSVDIRGYPYPLKVFTFLYRPLFFDVNSPIAIIASFENLFLLLLTVKLFRNGFFKAIKKASSTVRGALLFFIMGAASFSLILGNLGIMLRQKNMFMLMFYLFAFWVFYVKLYPKSYARK